VRGSLRKQQDPSPASLRSAPSPTRGEGQRRAARAVSTRIRASNAARGRKVGTLGRARARSSFAHPTASRLRRRELQQLDGVEVLDAAADALGGVEQHGGLGAVGIAQHADAGSLDDQVPSVLSACP
jgi:hypothetical protein